MTKRTKITIAIVALVILIVVGYFLFRKKKVAETPAVANNTPGTTSSTPTYVSDTFPFTVGSQGENVRRLQTALNFINPTNPLATDGVFGSMTRIKLLTTVASNLSVLPMPEANLNAIIKQGNNAQMQR